MQKGTGGADARFRSSVVVCRSAAAGRATLRRMTDDIADWSATPQEVVNELAALATIVGSLHDCADSLLAGRDISAVGQTGPVSGQLELRQLASRWLEELQPAFIQARTDAAGFANTYDAFADTLAQLLQGPTDDANSRAHFGRGLKRLAEAAGYTEQRLLLLLEAVATFVESATALRRQRLETSDCSNSAISAADIAEFEALWHGLERHCTLVSEATHRLTRLAAAWGSTRQAFAAMAGRSDGGEHPTSVLPLLELRRVQLAWRKAHDHLRKNKPGGS